MGPPSRREEGSDYCWSLPFYTGVTLLVLNLTHFCLLSDRLRVRVTLRLAVYPNQFESHGTHDHILLPQNEDFPNLEGQVPVFISPENRVAQLHPQALGSLFIASYNSQGYGGGIQPRLHMGLN
jgi:hypothetical protein